ncbi:MAG: hypothetical protein C5B51_29770 [Terriglobia bacterium]|nr:MAG: hypothetical protein C5B51_29770 [Terriglobia bacterium]
MSRRRQPAGFEGLETVSALSVSHNEADRDVLGHIFRELHWKLHFSSTVDRARAFLKSRGVPVLICDAAVPENWRTFFQYAQTLHPTPMFIVSSRLADERLWCEVLNIGAYDVLSTPFERREVAHVIRCAWDSAQHHSVAAASRAATAACAGAA